MSEMKFIMALSGSLERPGTLRTSPACASACSLGTLGVSALRTMQRRGMEDLLLLLLPDLARRGLPHRARAAGVERVVVAFILFVDLTTSSVHQGSCTITVKRVKDGGVGEVCG